MVKASARASGDILFVPRHIEKSVKKIAARISNDNGMESPASA